MFESYSACQDPRPHILFLSHCVPNPPDKGEKIRAHYELKALAKRYRVHLACLARNAEEVRQAEELSGRCASVHVGLVRPKLALAKAGAQFLFGACLNQAFYNNQALRQHVNALGRRIPLQAAFVYTAVMTPYVPTSLPMFLDMVDVDFEKWFQYARCRRPRLLYAAEARRMRKFERSCAERARQTILTTENEARILKGIAPGASAMGLENGVDAGFFDGEPRPLPDGLASSPFVAFVGTMDYHPNAEAAIRFTKEVFPRLRHLVPGLQFFVVGRNPSSAVLKLRNEPGVQVLGGVPDVRPYLSSAAAIVAPLPLARGIQNKVLEALAMGRKVFASDAVCRTFGAEVPWGVVRCHSAEEFVTELLQECQRPPACDNAIRKAAQHRFSWDRNMQKMEGELAAILEQPAAMAL